MTEYAPVLVGEDPPIGDAVEGIIVGADPLEVQDGDTAYVQTYLTGSFDASMVSFRLPPGATAAPGAKVSIAATRRATEGTAGLVINAIPAGEAFGGSIVRFPSVPAGGPYETTTVELDFALLPAEFAPQLLISPGTVFHINNTTVTGEDATLRTTWLRVIVEGETYLRNFPRDDGLGNSAPRNYPRSSRQRSPRDAGSYR